MDWLTHIVAFLAGLGGGWTLKAAVSVRSSRSNRMSKVSQNGNFAGGDIVAGDKSNNTSK